MTRTFICCIALAALLAACQAAPNIYPDPSFERTGEPGVARTGERAAHLQVGEERHWAGFGGAISVEPFARYRLTEWVRARVGEGTFYAPYCYQWNSYEWAFVSNHPVGTMDEWTQVEVTFVSPHDTMTVHPLAYIDAANCEGWADDIVVEKIAEPEEVIAELEATEQRSDDQNEILARWYVQHGQLDRARELMEGSSGESRADIATVIARSIEQPSRRQPYLVEVIAHGGPTYYQGVQTFGELTEGLSRHDVIEILVQGVAQNPGSERAGRAFRLVLTDRLRPDEELLTVTAMADEVQRVRAAVERALEALPDDSAAQQEVEVAMDELEDLEQEVAQRREELGECVVRLGGEAITGDTHVIVVPDEATDQEMYAARDLRYHLELITGDELPIRFERFAAGRVPIYVGRCDALADTAIDADSLGVEGIHVLSDGPALYLVGNRRGVLYATYVFLEEFLGCRWFTPECATWPTEGEIELAAIDHRYIPPLEYRATDYPRCRPASFALRNRLNGQHHHLSEEQGGKINYRGFVHTFRYLVPPEQHFAEHPEYYSEIDGERVGPDRTQLCLTNPDVLDIATETVRRWIEESPDAEIISVSQNDWHNYCECDRCSAVAEREGSQAGPLLHFVNGIAERIESDHPDVAIDTLAYQYTRKPPEHVTPRDNVIVRLCSIECCFLHPLATDPYNESFVEDIRGWDEICDRLYIWDYVINYRHSICPFPNLRVLKPNINFFIDHGVKGIYEEACYFTRGSELQELRGYILAKTLWDPDYDTDTAIREFCDAYYGDASPFIRRYLDLIHDHALSQEDLHIRIYTHPQSYLTPEVLAQASELFDQAEAAVAGDEEVLHRVQVARLPVMYARITLATSAEFQREGDRLIQRGDFSIAELAERFERIARKEGITRVAEGGPTPSLDEWLQSLPREPRALEIQTLRNSSLQVEVLPDLGGRVWRMRHARSGRELLSRAGEEGAWQPRDSGYEEYSGSGYRSPGWSEAYEVVEADERQITLQAGLDNGLRLTRRLELDGERARLRITSTLENVSGGDRDVCLRAHPQFAVTSTAEASVHVRRGDEWRVIDLARPDDPTGEFNEWLRGEAMPDGAWAVVDSSADVALAQHFRPDEVSQCLLNWDGAEGRVNLELYSEQRTLQPGESLQLHQQWEVLSPASQLL